MKTLRNFFGGTLTIVSMINFATASIKQECHQAEELLAKEHLNEAAQVLIKIHDYVRFGMYKIIAKHSPNSGIFPILDNCDGDVQHRGRPFESPIIISAWANGSVSNVGKCIFEEGAEIGRYTNHQVPSRGKFKFYNPIDVKSNEIVMEEELTVFLLNTTEEITLQDCAKWWTENFCRVARALIEAYGKKLCNSIKSFTEAELNYCLMTYKIFVESDGGHRGQQYHEFSQKGFWDAFVIVRNILGDIVLDPKANENAKRLVWTALENWDNPACKKLGEFKVEGKGKVFSIIGIYPIGYYQIEPDALAMSIYVAAEKKYTKFLSQEPFLTIIPLAKKIEKEHGEKAKLTVYKWAASYEQSLREKKEMELLEKQKQAREQFQEIVRPMPKVILPLSSPSSKTTTITTQRTTGNDIRNPNFTLTPQKVVTPRKFDHNVGQYVPEYKPGLPVSEQSLEWQAYNSFRQEKMREQEQQKPKGQWKNVWRAWVNGGKGGLNWEYVIE